MLALLLYLWLGPQPALAELLAELAIGLSIIGGGGGTRLRRTLRLFLETLRQRAPLPT